MKIGKKLKLLRKDRKMTLKELSKESGVAVATLSRMEHNIMPGTLESHINICKALRVGLSDFYKEIETESKTLSLIKEKEKHDSYVHPKKSTIEMLTTKIMDKKMMPVLIRIDRNGQTPKEENRPGTEKFIYMIEGSLTAIIDKKENDLSKGDSLYFDASLPHVFKNESNKQAVAISVVTPPVF